MEFYLESCLRKSDAFCAFSNRDSRVSGPKLPPLVGDCTEFNSGKPVGDFFPCQYRPARPTDPPAVLLEKSVCLPFFSRRVPKHFVGLRPT